MSRISIDVTDEQHKRLKAMAALQGMSIKDFVLASTLGNLDMEPDGVPGLAELETLLDERLANARARGTGSRTVRDIVGQLTREANESGPNG